MSFLLHTSLCRTYPARPSCLRPHVAHILRGDHAHLTTRAAHVLHAAHILNALVTLVP